MIIDSHCHLTYEPMSKNLEETIQNANRDGDGGGEGLSKRPG